MKERARGAAILCRHRRSRQVKTCFLWEKKWRPHRSAGTGVGIGRGVRKLSEAGIALRRFRERWIGDRIAKLIDARRIDPGIDNSECVAFRNKCLLVGDPGLEVMDALHVRKT